MAHPGVTFDAQKLDFMYANHAAGDPPVGINTPAIAHTQGLAIRSYEFLFCKLVRGGVPLAAWGMLASMSSWPKNARTVIETTGDVLERSRCNRCETETGDRKVKYAKANVLVTNVSRKAEARYGNAKYVKANAFIMNEARKAHVKKRVQARNALGTHSRQDSRQVMSAHDVADGSRRPKEKHTAHARNKSRTLRTRETFRQQGARSLRQEIAHENRQREFRHTDFGTAMRNGRGVVAQTFLRLYA